jgi:hypothetical protein
MLIGETSINASVAASNNFKYLWDAEVSVFSQNGEDGILNYICNKLDIGKPSIVEIGAGNFTECNSRFLAEHRSANVLAVDFVEELSSQVKKLDVIHKTNIQTLKTWVTPENIQSIIEYGHKNFGQIDIFSIDIDGNDYWVLESANLDKIRVVIVEFNPLLARTLPVSVPKDNEFDRTRAHFSWTYYGANLYAFNHLLSSKGFKLLGTTRHGSNAFYIREQEMKYFTLKVDMDLFSDVRARENRNIRQELALISGNDRQQLIVDMPVINVKTMERTTVGDSWELH